MDSNQTSAVVTTVSPHSVADTVGRLTELIAAHGLTLFAVVDHSGGAAAVGLEMPDTKLLIFGSPRAGTPVMLAAPLAALDLPLRVLVFTDERGHCQVSYLSTESFAARYGLADDVVKPLDGVAALVAAVTAPAEA
jgi:uncharacterized protein (DUF302 family)